MVKTLEKQIIRASEYLTILKTSLTNAHIKYGAKPNEKSPFQPLFDSVDSVQSIRRKMDKNVAVSSDDKEILLKKRQSFYNQLQDAKNHLQTLAANCEDLEDQENDKLRHDTLSIISNARDRLDLLYDVLSSQNVIDVEQISSSQSTTNDIRPHS